MTSYRATCTDCSWTRVFRSEERACAAATRHTCPPPLQDDGTEPLLFALTPHAEPAEPARAPRTVVASWLS